MAVVYAITNKINGKKYVGVTERDLNKRFNEHCRDSRRDRCKNRLLYLDMNKYGFKNFYIEGLEECSNDIKFERESFWIDKLNTYDNGYNLTYGGAGKKFYDYKEIVNKYLELGTVKSVCRFFNCDHNTVKIACEEYNIKIASSAELSKANYSKQVVMLDIVTEKLLDTFCSSSDASRYLGDKNKRRHIVEVCNGTRHTAYGYKWMWLKDYLNMHDKDITA